MLFKIQSVLLRAFLANSTSIGVHPLSWRRGAAGMPHHLRPILRSNRDPQDGDKVSGIVDSILRRRQDRNLQNETPADSTIAPTLGESWEDLRLWKQFVGFVLVVIGMVGFFQFMKCVCTNFTLNGLPSENTDDHRAKEEKRREDWNNQMAAWTQQEQEKQRHDLAVYQQQQAWNL